MLTAFLSANFNIKFLAQIAFNCLSFFGVESAVEDDDFGDVAVEGVAGTSISSNCRSSIRCHISCLGSVECVGGCSTIKPVFFAISGCVAEPESVDSWYWGGVGGDCVVYSIAIMLLCNCRIVTISQMQVSIGCHSGSAKKMFVNTGASPPLLHHKNRIV